MEREFDEDLVILPTGIQCRGCGGEVFEHQVPHLERLRTDEEIGGKSYVYSRRSFMTCQKCGLLHVPDK
jgi:hypothetical protein